MIKFGSALDSIMKRGIAHDGPVNVKPSVETIVAKVPEVTTADKIEPKRREQATRTTESDANISGKAARDARYKESHAQELKEKARLRMAAKRAKSK